MPQHARPQMCLSTESHDNRVLDVSKHYFGCLNESKRQRFYDGLPEKSQRRILREAHRVAQLKAKLESQPKSKAGALLVDFKDAIKDWRAINGWSSADGKTTSELSSNLENSVDSEIKASMIFFKQSRPYSLPGVENKFPNQKISISKLLANEPDKNPLMAECDDDMIRYFHLPANNMIWVEEAVARYYHEKRPDAEDLYLKSKLGGERTKTEMLLAPEFWQGQQDFNSKSEVHARHMRPLCDVISTNSISTEPLPKNLVLFMPYLHWETDRGRIQSAAAIKEASTIKLSMAEIVDRAKVANEQISHADGALRTQNELHQRPCTDYPMGTAASTQKRQLLGRVFLQAAALMEAIDCRIEEKLILEYLHKKPPLHPRRTLDQSHYVGLKDTASRDRDQVVYRATMVGEHDCEDNIDTNDPWKRCKQCQEDSMKMPRLIIVDQLWLWILDEKTVITCFPRRWGKIRPDSSAVHKSLRLRLKNARKDEIRSSYDLALIVIDECSRIFFDRTKTADRQPNMVDMFAGAIRDVTYSQTAAFDQFLIYTQLLSKNHNSHDSAILLSINPEGNLLKEIKDILDELHILIKVKLQQQTVVSSFVKQIKQFLLPNLSSRSTWHPMMSILEEEHDNESEFGSKERRQAATLTMARANHLLDDISSRIGELKALEENARKTANALKDILALKQQQAGVIEAREAVSQARETLKQGKSIMLFTVVTIVFLPLSFCTSFFGMNTEEFNDSHLTLAQELTYSLPISVCIIGFSFLLAFGHSSIMSSIFALLIAIIQFPVNLVSTWLFIKSGLYSLSRKIAAKTNAFREEENKRTAIMKADAMKKNMELESFKKLYQSPNPDDEGFQMPRARLLTSRTGTSRFGNSPHLTAAEFDDDIERGNVSRDGSQARLTH